MSKNNNAAHTMSLYLDLDKLDVVQQQHQKSTQKDIKSDAEKVECMNKIIEMYNIDAALKAEKLKLQKKEYNARSNLQFTAIKYHNDTAKSLQEFAKSLSMSHNELGVLCLTLLKKHFKNWSK